MAGSTLSSLVVDSDSSRRTRLGNTVHLAAQHDSSKVDCDSERIWVRAILRRYIICILYHNIIFILYIYIRDTRPTMGPWIVEYYP